MQSPSPPGAKIDFEGEAGQLAAGGASGQDWGDLIGPADPMDAVALERALHACVHIRGPVAHSASVDSTSTRALQAAQAGARAGVWTADEQTAGRGRGGHSWHSSPGEGLYCSTLIAPRLSAGGALLLSLATGLAAQAAMRACTGLQADLRWPNDLLLGGRKCGGILVETSLAPPGAGDDRGGDGLLRYAVIGVGINVHQASFPPELAATATSLRLAGTGVRRQQLLTSLLQALDAELTLLDSPPQTAANTCLATTGLLRRFTEASTWVTGKRVSVPEDGGYTGITAGLNASGFLLVRDQGGVERVVRSGGVRELADLP